MKRFVGVNGYVDEAELCFYDPDKAEETRICISWEDMIKMPGEIQEAIQRNVKVQLREAADKYYREKAKT